jgi:hypothetical protein
VPGRVVADSGGLLHPMQGHVHQQRADHPTLRATPLGGGQETLIEHARTQPMSDQPSGREGPQHPEQMIMIEVVERGRQIGV